MEINSPTIEQETLVNRSPNCEMERAEENMSDQRTTDFVENSHSITDSRNSESTEKPDDTTQSDDTNKEALPSTSVDKMDLEIGNGMESLDELDGSSRPTNDDSPNDGGDPEKEDVTDMEFQDGSAVPVTDDTTIEGSNPVNTEDNE
ncbi:Hypothetical predicted protein, partial [Mytilus galloprovincialis]